MKWRIAELNKERRELLKLIGDSFFSEQSETPIPLSNQVPILPKVTNICNLRILQFCYF
jgi:hypothetical protein